MPILLRFCLLSSFITGFVILANAHTLHERKAIDIKDFKGKDTVHYVGIAVNKLKPVNDTLGKLPENSVIESDEIFAHGERIKKVKELFNQQASQPDTGNKKILLDYKKTGHEDPNSKKKSRLDCRETNLINKDGVADSYPFISADGLRLYFTSNRQGGHGRFFISKRNNIKDPFGEAEVLSENLTDGYYSGTLTTDELTLCMVKSGKVYISKRQNTQSKFGSPIQVQGIADGFHYGPAISPDGSQIIVMSSMIGSKSNVAGIYKKVTDGIYREAGILSTPKDAEIGPGQFSKDGLSYYAGFETSTNGVSIWRYTRKSVNDDFVDLEELPVKINGFQRNFQPSVNADASIIVYTTSQNNLWEEDDIVLVNDELKNLSAPEQFTQIAKNNAGTLTIKGKIVSAVVKVFPNPFQNEIIFEMNEIPGAGTTFILYDLNGKMIKQQAITSLKTNIQLAGLPSATYIYQVTGEGKTLISSGKLVKI